MSINKDDKRLFPRFKKSLKIKVNKNTAAESIDVSEDGLCFLSNETISSPSIALSISFPLEHLELKANARLVWCRSLEEGSSLYGIEFINLDESQKLILRKELIASQINNLLNEIKDSKTRKDISDFFFRDILAYVTEITKIAYFVSKYPQYSSEEIEKRVCNLSNEILLKGYYLEELIENKIIMNKNKAAFRALVGTWAYKSPMMRRGFEKPKGYPGDYLMLENVYDNQPLVKEGIGYYFDKYFLGGSYAVAVRYRKDKLRALIGTAIRQNQAKNIKIFDIACGSCREIREIPRTLFKEKTAVFTCLDWDKDALEFSRDKLKDFPAGAKFNFIKEDIMNLIKDQAAACSFEKQDLIYSIGLIDYLPDRILKLFIQFFFKILKIKGKLILTHKNREKTFSPVGPDWFCNWKFVPRSKDEIMRLFHNCKLQNLSLSSEVDEFNDIFYFTLVKQK